MKKKSKNGFKDIFSAAFVLLSPPQDNPLKKSGNFPGLYL